MSGAALVNAFNACAALSINVFSTDITLALFDIAHWTDVQLMVCWKLARL